MPRADRLLIAAGVLVWMAVGVTVVAGAWPPDGPAAWVRMGAWAMFGLSFVACMYDVPARDGPQWRWVLAQTCSALALFALSPQRADIEVALLVVVAGQLPAFLTTRAVLLWIACQSAIALSVTYQHSSLFTTVVLHVSFFAFQLFASGTMVLATSERRARALLARANAELQALHLMLEHETRQAERLHIARELHDSLGHGLTAMALELEAARHHANVEARSHVDRAQQLSKALLSEVRDVVSSMRGAASVDLSTALRALAEKSQQPMVELALPVSLAVEDTAVAHAIVRAVQEAITNARRHAGASRVHVTLGAHAGTLHLDVRDDGRGATTDVRPGLGLQGMRERFEQLGGSFDVRTAPGQGFTIAASVPLRVAAAVDARSVGR